MSQLLLHRSQDPEVTPCDSRAFCSVDPPHYLTKKHQILTPLVVHSLKVAPQNLEHRSPDSGAGSNQGRHLVPLGRVRSRLWVLPVFTRLGPYTTFPHQESSRNRRSILMASGLSRTGCGRTERAAEDAREGLHGHELLSSLAAGPGATPCLRSLYPKPSGRNMGVP